MFPSAHFNLGSLLLARQDLDAAATCFEAALSARPDHGAALWSLVLIRLAQVRPADGLVALDRLLALEPSHLAGRRQRAAVLSAIGRPEDALADLTAVLEMRADDVEALTGRGGRVADAGTGWTRRR